MTIDDEMIAAAVKSGNYSDPAAEKYLADTLIKRKNAILKAYLPKVNPIVDPALDSSGVLGFENAAAGLVPPNSTSYDTTWYRFDNATGETAALGDSPSSAMNRIQAPVSLPAAVDSFVRVDIRSINAAYPSWTTPVHVYFRRTNGGWRLVGLYRTSNGELVAQRNK